MSEMREFIDTWRVKHWGQSGSCAGCGDPIILADTEDWPAPLCFHCWDELTPKQRAERAAAPEAGDR